MELRRINSLLVTLVEFDKIPFHKLLHSSSVADMQARYNFSNAEVAPGPQDQPKLVFMLGTLSNQNKTQGYLIKRLEIEERKIIIDVDGPSQIADDFFVDVVNYMQEISGEENFKMQTIVQSKDSEIVSKLDFSATQLVHPKLLEYVETRVVKEAQQEMGKAIANLLAVIFRIDYFLTEEKLKDYRITLSRKEFLIGPRDGTALDEQIFVSKAPVDTHTHLALLEELEAIYS